MAWVIGYIVAWEEEIQNRRFLLELTPSRTRSLGWEATASKSYFLRNWRILDDFGAKAAENLRIRVKNGAPNLASTGPIETQSAKLPLNAKMRNATPATTKCRIEIHAHEMHANVVHGHNVHTREVHAMRCTPM